MAFAEDECGPTDGPALVIYLLNTEMKGTKVPYPHVRISIWRAAAELSGRTLRWRNEGPSMGMAVRCSEAGKCQRATSVKLEFRSREADGSIPGALELDFEDGESIRGGFRAAWRDRQVLCG